MDITTIKPTVLGIIGAGGAVATYMLGGWDTALQTLLIFMTVDYITGLLVAGLFHKSKKSEQGALSSKAGYQGLCRKGMVLLIVRPAWAQSDGLKSLVCPSSGKDIAEHQGCPS